MSRHRKQQIRRQQSAAQRRFNELDPILLGIALQRYDNTGLYPRWLEKTAKMYLERYYGKEIR